MTERQHAIRAEGVAVRGSRSSGRPVSKGNGCQRFFNVFGDLDVAQKGRVIFPWDLPAAPALENARNKDAVIVGDPHEVSSDRNVPIGGESMNHERTYTSVVRSIV